MRLKKDNTKQKGWVDKMETCVVSRRGLGLIRGLSSFVKYHNGRCMVTCYVVLLCVLVIKIYKTY